MPSEIQTERMQSAIEGAHKLKLIVLDACRDNPFASQMRLTVANRSIGDEWILLEVGMTLLDRTPDYKLTREALSLETPDGKTLPLPSATESQRKYQGLQSSRYCSLVDLDRSALCAFMSA